MTSQKKYDKTLSHEFDKDQSIGIDRLVEESLISTTGLIFQVLLLKRN